MYCSYVCCVFFQARTESCDFCSKYIETLVPSLSNSRSHNESLRNVESEAQEAETQARELELELARTKLALVESECKNQVSFRGKV